MDEGLELVLGIMFFNLFVGPWALFRGITVLSPFTEIRPKHETLGTHRNNRPDEALHCIVARHGHVLVFRYRFWRERKSILISCGAAQTLAPHTGSNDKGVRLPVHGRGTYAANQETSGGPKFTAHLYRITNFMVSIEN
ncbi:hypothetical protein GGX14DRAFT_387638 [Mycena pura]|uniref:Uncharacterized protein n=1 Tax=Mycena pura TaxID=153505 RepID=A0AAD6YLV6_9AGAR|nr:hypothetical protein GGX14DRAFT_387638 [Mycena pura]